jgi:hypothetical protein
MPHTIALAQSMAPLPSSATPRTMRTTGTPVLTISPSGAAEAGARGLLFVGSSCHRGMTPS